MKFLNINDSSISITGRYESTLNESWRFSFPGVSIKLRFKNSTVSARILDFGNDGMNNHFNVLIDGNIHSVIKLSNEIKDIELYKKVDDNWHTIELFKRTESNVGECDFYGFILDDDAIIERVNEPELLLEFIGDSITCGYGIEAKSATDPFEDSTENAWLSYASVVARELNARHIMVSYSGKGVYRNWGSEPFTGTTLSEIYSRTLADRTDSHWNFKNVIPSIVVVNLGSNDFSPPHFANEQLFKEAYSNLIKTIRSNYGESCFIFCVTGPVLVKTLGDAHKNYIESIIENHKGNGDTRIFAFSLTRQTSRIGFGAQWHPNIEQSRKNGIEIAEFIKKKITTV